LDYRKKLYSPKVKRLSLSFERRNAFHECSSTHQHLLYRLLFNIEIVHVITNALSEACVDPFLLSLAAEHKLLPAYIAANSNLYTFTRHASFVPPEFPLRNPV
jgi:hypothetical protein